jgi:hypothetical protein
MVRLHLNFTKYSSWSSDVYIYIHIHSLFLASLITNDIDSNEIKLSKEGMAGGLLVPDGIIRPVVSASALTWFIRYIYY